MASEVIYSSDGKLIDGIIVKYYEPGKMMSETPYIGGKINGTVNNLTSHSIILLLYILVYYIQIYYILAIYS